MNETDELIDEILGDEEVKIPVNDKRRFGSEGERMGGGPGTEPKEPQISPRELELEARLKEETTRREAAESKLVGVQAKFEEAKANLEKETADMRARLKKTLEDRAKQSQFDFLKTLLPVLDNLDLAISASETDPSVEHLRDGVIGTARSFEQALLSVGVEPVPGVGADFNPEVHEAIDMAEVEVEQDGKVTSEYQRGYRFGDQLLRPARVQVGRGRAQSASE
jgi:molecular chaperone GrpE